MPSKGQLTGMTGVYLVAAELARRGFIACPTSRSARGADILVADQNCQHAYTLQVKTNAVSRDYWLLNPHAKDMVAATHFYVLVNLGKDVPEFFIVPSRVIARKMSENTSGNATFYGIWLDDITRFQDKWDLLGKVVQGP